MKIRNVLITGGAGFIGSNLSLKLINEGFNVTVLDNLSNQIHGFDPDKSPLFINIKDKVNFIRGDVTIRENWEKSIQGQDAIVHLAAETGTGQSMYSIEQYTKSNISGTALLWDIIGSKNNSIKKVVIASSRAIYGEGRYNCKIDGIVYPESRIESDMRNGDFNVKCPICGENVELMSTTEDSLIHPTSIYGFTKYAQEELSLIAGKSLKVPVVAFRYQNVYGPGQSLSNPYTGILSIFSTRIKNGNDIQIFEDGNESRDFVYIDDVVEATKLGLDMQEADYQRINVGTGVSTNVLTVAETLKERFKYPVSIKITGNYRLGDIRSNYADISKIQNVLKFSPRVEFSTGIEEFVKWVNKQEVRVDNYDSSIEEMKQKGLFK